LILTSFLAAAALAAQVSPSPAGGPVAGPAETPVVARAGDRFVGRAALDEAVQRRLNSGYFHSLAPEKRQSLEVEELRKLLRQEMDVLGGLDRGLALPLARAEADRAAIEKQLGKVAYEQSIGLRKWSREDHAKVLAEGLLATEARTRFVVEPARVGDAEVRGEFEANRSRYRAAEMRRVSHILLRVPPGSAEEKWVASEKDAKELLGRLAKGESFADLAAARSEDMYRIKGGDLGWVHRGRLVGPLEAAVWSAAEGTLVGPVRSEEGVHVARVSGHREARAMTLDEAAPAIRADLGRTKLEAAEEAWYSAVRSRHPVVVLDPALAAAAR
jgi:parvulin-like peptidyl-prolyl isomerase